MGILESLVVGTVQGITEWLPISSEGMTSLVMTQVFGSSLQQAVIIALWLHIGTLLAALVYFRKDILEVIRERGTVFRFLVIATLVSVLVGGPLALVMVEGFLLYGRSAMVLIGVLLIGTGIFQHVSRRAEPAERKPSYRDAVLAGFVQGLAVLPGLSRSGLTVSALLLRRYRAEQAVRLSFLMSVPAVALAGLYASAKGAMAGAEAAAALVASFVLGLLTIAVLLKAAEKINFSYFTVLMGFLSVLAGFLI